MSDAQKRAILKDVVDHPSKIGYHVDSNLRNDLYEIAPYVVGFRIVLRGFYCEGLSSLGESFLSQ